MVDYIKARFERAAQADRNRAAKLEPVSKPEAEARVSHEGARPTGRFDLVELAGEVMSTVETP
jgi:hypothetical protein